MSAKYNLERRLAEHYAAEAPNRAPDWVLERILASVDGTAQRRTILVRPWRFPPTLSRARLAVATIAIVLALSVIPLFAPVARPTPSPTTGPSTSPGPGTPVWPQTSLEEVRRAQKLADVGDPRIAWQVSPDRWYQPDQNHPIDTEFFDRFFEEELGWQDFRWDEAFAHREAFAAGDVAFVRCAPSGTNPLYPDDAEGCAPTIDDLRYETVKVHVAQLDREGASGIWVVTGWEVIESARQVKPPSDAEIAALVDRFGQARIEGQGAENFVDLRTDDANADQRIDQSLPLIYATSTGAHYERSAFEVLSGPAWPEAEMFLTVRLFSGGGNTVVEQVFGLTRDSTGALRLVYDFETPTTENGKPVPVQYGFLDGVVTYRAAAPLGPSHDGSDDPGRLAVEGLLPDDDAPRQILVFLADPRPVGLGCGPALGDAAAIANSIGSDTTAVTIGGRPALRMDGVVATAGTCGLVRYVPSAHARLYLVDLPGGAARVLGIAISSDADSFETMLGWATPVIDSIEFHAP